MVLRLTNDSLLLTNTEIRVKFVFHFISDIFNFMLYSLNRKSTKLTIEIVIDLKRVFPLMNNVSPSKQFDLNNSF